jgi:hypothetical protein
MENGSIEDSHEQGALCGCARHGEPEGVSDMTIPIEHLESLSTEDIRAAGSERAGNVEDEILLIPSLQEGRGGPGRRCRKKSAKYLAKKWKKVGAGVPSPSFRASFMGGIVAEWREQKTLLEFSRKVKKAWIDVSSPEGDWGMEFNLKSGKGWKKLQRVLSSELLK